MLDYNGGDKVKNFKCHQYIPQVVKTICWNFDAWIVGSSATALFNKAAPDSDWDVIVPPERWNEAALTLVEHKPLSNSFGGWKIPGRVVIDVWPDTLNAYLLKSPIKIECCAYHPKSGMFICQSV